MRIVLIVVLLALIPVAAYTHQDRILELVHSAVSTLHLNDNVKIQMGDSRDAEMYFDGTDLVIDPDAVGSGVLAVGGAITSDVASGSEALILVGGAKIQMRSGGTDSTVIESPGANRIDIGNSASGQVFLGASGGAVQVSTAFTVTSTSALQGAVTSSVTSGNEALILVGGAELQYRSGGTTTTSTWSSGVNTVNISATGGTVVIGDAATVAGILTITSGNLSLTETTIPTPVAGVATLWSGADDTFNFIDGSGVNHIIGGTASVMTFTHETSPSGVHYMGGYYDASAADANLTDGSLTVNLGTAASGARSAHAFLVAAAAGTVDAGTVSIVVSGTSITDLGVRTPADSEVLVSSIVTMSTDQYFETSLKWLGQVVYTLTPAGATTFAADFNWGYAKYHDHGNQDFLVSRLDCGWQGSATDTGVDIELLFHTATGWTYSAAAFVPGNGAIASCIGDLDTDCKSISGDDNSWRKDGLSSAVTGALAEGILMRVTQGTNNSIDSLLCSVGIVL